MSLAEWLAEIGPFPKHDFLIFRDHRAANASFGGIDAKSVKEVVITDDVANSWPASANHAFKKIAKHVQYAMRAQPFLYIEPDAVILRASAFDEIEAEYGEILKTGKHFLGDLIDHRSAGANFVVHMSGCGVYPGNMTQYAGEVFYADDKTPWDISAGPAIHSQAKQSELIFHVWNQKGQGLAPFTSWSDVEQKIFARRPKCAIFHSDKTGTLLQLLRERRKEGDVKCAAPVTTCTEEALPPSPALSTRSASSAEPTSQPESSAEINIDCPTMTLHPIPECDKIWVKVDREGNSLGVFEFDGKEWVPVKWPRRDNNYATICTIENVTEPWTDKATSITEIQTLAARLRQFQTNVAYVRFVRSLLAEAGVIVLPKKKKRRKKRK